MIFVVNLALSWILEDKKTNTKTNTRRTVFNRTFNAIAILSWSCSVIRSELALLLGPLTVYLLLTRRITTMNAIMAGFVGGAGGAIMSGMVDSYFWGRWTWPEMEAVVFNVVEGKSEEWGVSYSFSRGTCAMAHFTDCLCESRYLHGTLTFLCICQRLLSSDYLSLNTHRLPRLVTASRESLLRASRAL